MIYALTLADARHRSAHLTVAHYDLWLGLTDDPATAETFAVTSEITLTSAAAGIVLDYLGESVTAVEVDGAPVEYLFADGQIRLEVPVDTRCSVKVAGRSRYSRTGQGLHRFTDPADSRTYLYSHFEPSDARRVYPCFDQPDLKATFSVRMSVPEGWTALANGAETGRVDGTVHFAETRPMSTYLTAFAAGEYVRAGHATSEGVELGVWARASMAEFVDEEFLQITARGLPHFNEVFGYPYPWGKYDSILVPEYNLGAMENPGLVTFTESYLFQDRATRAQHAARANTILHEMSHMWFGDLVTPKWWDDLWLKESFAEFMGADASLHVSDYAEARANFAGDRKNWAYQQDQLPTTHPIAAEIPDVDAARQNFDGITYAKGAAVLTQLVHYIGREAFFAGARDYFSAHAFSSATFADLLAALSAHTDVDLGEWADRWLRTTGPDRLDPARVGDTLTLAHEGNRPHRLDVGVYAAGRRIEGIDVTVPAEADEVTVELPAGAELVIVNDTDQTYALTGLDKRSLLWLTEHLSEIEDPLARAVVWTSLWNLCRDGRLPVADYVAIAARHAPREDNPGMIARTLGAALQAARDYTADDTLADRLAEQLWNALGDAEPGSDTQLAIARVTIAALSSEGSGEGLRMLLDARLPGLTVDNQLAWSIRAALAACDEISREELDEAHARDATLSGKTRHLRAVWAAPSAETKTELFDTVTAPGRWSNDEVDALLAAYNAPGSQPLRAHLDRRFFGQAAQIWEEHPMEIANRLVRGLYPDVAGEVPGELPAALRRVLAECADQRERAARLRALNG